MRQRYRAAAVVVGGLSLLFATACGGGSGESTEKKLTFTSYGSGYQKAQASAWLKPWAKKNGIQTVQDQPTDYAKIKTQVESRRVTWDVVDTEPFFPVGNCGKYAEKLDFKVIDTSNFPKGTVSDCAVPDALYSLTLVYDKKKYGDDPPTSMADFFDLKKYPGKRLAPGFASGGSLEAALVADGVSPDALYPLDYDRAFEKLDTIRDQTTFWETSAESQQALEANRVGMALVWSGRAYLAEKNGASYAPVWQDSMLAYATLMVPKGAPHKDLAMKYIAYATSAEPQARFVEQQPYAPVNKKARPKLDAQAKQWDVSRKDIQRQGYFQDVKWWGKNLDQATKKWTTWSTG